MLCRRGGRGDPWGNQNVDRWGNNGYGTPQVKFNNLKYFDFCYDQK